ncbi:MAG: SMI1/KNR4 family protein [Propionibacteriaceae bacterium]
MSEFAAGLPRRAGADPGVLQQALSDLRVTPPEDYLQFMLASDGAEGAVGEGYVQLWSAGELVELNEGYGVKEFAPGLVLFGSDGGDEAFAFDTSTSPARIVNVPFIGMAREEATVLGSTFAGFLSTLANDFVA